MSSYRALSIHILCGGRANYLYVMLRRGCMYHISHVFMCTAFSRWCAMVVRRLTTSYEIAQPPYDCNRFQMLTSASWQIIIVKSTSYDCRMTVVHMIIYVPVIVPTASQPHLSCVTTKLRLQYRNRVGDNHIYLGSCPIARHRSLV